MSSTEDVNYDSILSNILVNEKSILGFLSTIFNFLARRTDFYYVPNGPYENIGFPPGVAEELVIKVMRACDPKNQPLNTPVIADDFMTSTVAQEVEIESEEVATNIENIDFSTIDIQSIEKPETNVKRENMKTDLIKIDTDKPPNIKKNLHYLEHSKTDSTRVLDTQNPTKLTANQKELELMNYEPPQIPVQSNSESYNGAVKDNYSWSQTIQELDVTVKLPPNIKKSKDLRVTITATEICIECSLNKEVILKDTFTYKIKPSETLWSVSSGKLSIHLEKQQERWWNALLNSESHIDLSKIDCSRPLDELPEDHIAKVRELQWNHERKLKGEPTSDDIRKMEILKKAWNVEGSPFKGKEFDPNILQ